MAEQTHEGADEGGPADGTSARPGGAPPPTTVLGTLEKSLAAHDREAAVRLLLEAVNAGMPLETLYSDVVGPFLDSVGVSWQDGRTSIWQEHVATQSVRTAVEALYPHVLARKASVEPVPVTVAFFCPPKEAHDVGLRILADLFDLKGFRTVYVGAGTPVHQMVDAAIEADAAVVCLSASTHYHRIALQEAVTALEEAVPGVRILVGGAAFREYPAEWAPYFVGDLDALFDELAAAGRRVAGRGSTAEESTGGSVG